MIGNISSNDVANQISMMRSAFKGTVVVVEGVTDSRVYSKFADKDNTQIVIAYSKDNARRAVTECRVSRRDLKVIGIIDSDLGRLNGKTVQPPLFETDKRDLECMMISSRALDDVLAEYADTEQMEEFIKANGPVRDAIARASAPIGILMYISDRDHLCLCFKDLDYRTFVDRSSLKINLRMLLEDIYSVSKNPQIGKKALSDRLYRELGLLEDPWDAARGHDAVAVLTIALTKVFGSYNAGGLKEGQVGGALRLAFSADDFELTDLYRDTSEWSRKTENPLWISH